jgi:tRNA G10  N-methylase Trm11
MPTLKLVQGDSLEFLRKQKDRTFSAACFSPPYGTSKGMFDVRKDFTTGGKFLPYALELSRICDVWAINLTQRVVSTKNTPFLEQLTMSLVEAGVELFDRWVVVKPTSMPLRGNRALTRFEFVLLYSRYAHSLTKHAEGCTVLPVTVHALSSQGASNHARNDITPYYSEIPRQVFSMYGKNGSGVVLDPFAGTGTSLKVAQELGLSSVGVEKDLDIFAALQHRFSPSRK